MSTSSPQSHEQQQGHDHDYEQPDGQAERIYERASSAYRTHIVDNPYICTRCFRRVKHVFLVAVPADAVDRHDEADLPGSVDTDPQPGTDTAVLEVADHVDDPDVVHPPRVRDLLDAMDVPVEWERASPPPKTVCECGAVDKDQGRATLGRETLVEEYIPRLGARLEEQNVAFDAFWLKHLADELKGKPAAAGRDDEIFAHAVRASIERVEPVAVRSVELEDGALQAADPD